MSVTAVVGLSGAGKSSLLAYLFQQKVLDERQERLDECIKQIRKFNANRRQKLSEPKQAPIYSNVEFSVPIGYQKKFTPFWLNPYRLGLPKVGEYKVQPVLPNSLIIFDEMDETYDSRKKSLPEIVSGLYYKHRHFKLDIYFILHRYMNVDTKIRDNINFYIEVQKCVHETNELGNIIKTTWYCREFEGSKNFAAYVDNNEKTYKETTYVYEGDIFELYDSFEYSEEFIPPEGQDFSQLPQPSQIDIKTLPKDLREFYKVYEPPDFRKKSEGED